MSGNEASQFGSDARQLFINARFMDSLRMIAELHCTLAEICRATLMPHILIDVLREESPVPWPPQSSDLTLLDFFFGVV